jgi:nucleotide-binding universal stress UspA family protein
MTPRAIVSYDDTPNDQDALALAKLLGDNGVELVLAYVRHATGGQSERERLEESEAQALLEHGAGALGDVGAKRRVVVSASTADGLRWLAEQEDAEIIVFGSDYRTAAGHVAPQRTAHALLEGGPAAIAIAPANYRSDHSAHFGRVGVLATAGDDEAIETARAVAELLGARVTRDEPYVDLLVVGSRPEAPHGRVMISSHAQHQIENATSPVLVLARGVALRFPAHVGA